MWKLFQKYLSYKRSFTLATESDQIILPAKAKAADCHRKTSKTKT